MSLRRPDAVDVKDDGRLLDVLAGFYDKLVELARPSRATTVTQTIAAATTDTKVFHGLGTVVTTWTVVDRNANATVWRSSTPNPSPALYIILQASAPVTVKVAFT